MKCLLISLFIVSCLVLHTQSKVTEGDYSKCYMSFMRFEANRHQKRNFSEEKLPIKVSTIYEHYLKMLDNCLEWIHISKASQKLKNELEEIEKTMKKWVDFGKKNDDKLNKKIEVEGVTVDCEMLLDKALQHIEDEVTGGKRKLLSH